MRELTKRSDFIYGMSVQCIIDGAKIDDAKVSISHSGDVYICQMEKCGYICDNTLGYDGSWYIDFDVNGNCTYVDYGKIYTDEPAKVTKPKSDIPTISSISYTDGVVITPDGVKVDMNLCDKELKIDDIDDAINTLRCAEDRWIQKDSEGWKV